MASITDLFDDEPIVNDGHQEPGTGGNGEQEPPKTPQDGEGDDNGGEQEDIIATLLKRQGIVDPEKIKFEGEDGTMEERSWDDLSYEEQLNILTGDQEPPSSSEPEDDLDDNEIDLINLVRQAKVTPEEYLQQIKQQAVQEYLAQNGGVEQTYAVDDYTDDELFIYDMQVRMPELTEEELTQALESAKANEVVFNKQINGLRAEYKKLEESKIQQDQLIAQQQQQEEFNQYANAVWEGINNQEDIAGTFELEDEDKQMLAQFILGQDQAGVSLLGKALNDPQTLIEMSWFALKGKEAIDSINEYYKEQITKAREAGYNKGLEDGKKGTSKPASSKVTTKSGKSKLVKREIKTIDDLDFE